MSAAEMVNEYLDAFYCGQFDKARDLVADDFHFKGPFAEADSKEAYFASAAGLASIVRGHRLLRQWEHGDEVCSWHEVDLETPAASGTIPMGEWHTVASGKLVSGRVLLDTAAFRALMPQQ